MGVFPTKVESSWPEKPCGLSASLCIQFSLATFVLNSRSARRRPPPTHILYKGVVCDLCFASIPDEVGDDLF